MSSNNEEVETVHTPISARTRSQAAKRFPGRHHQEDEVEHGCQSEEEGSDTEDLPEALESDSDEESNEPKKNKLGKLGELDVFHGETVSAVEANAEFVPVISTQNTVLHVASAQQQQQAIPSHPVSNPQVSLHGLGADADNMESPAEEERVPDFTSENSSDDKEEMSKVQGVEPQLWDDEDLFVDQIQPKLDSVNRLVIDEDESDRLHSEDNFNDRLAEPDLDDILDSSSGFKIQSSQPTSTVDRAQSARQISTFGLMFDDETPERYSPDQLRWIEEFVRTAPELPVKQAISSSEVVDVKTTGDDLVLGKRQRAPEEIAESTEPDEPELQSNSKKRLRINDYQSDAEVPRLLGSCLISYQYSQ